MDIQKSNNNDASKRKGSRRGRDRMVMCNIYLFILFMNFFLVCFVNLYYKALQSYFCSFCFCICNLCISLCHCKLDYENKYIYRFTTTYAISVSRH